MKTTKTIRLFSIIPIVCPMRKLRVHIFASVATHNSTITSTIGSDNTEFEFTLQTESRFAAFIQSIGGGNDFTNPFTKVIHTIHTSSYLRQNSDLLRFLAIQVAQRDLRARGSVVLFGLISSYKTLRYSVDPWYVEALRGCVNQNIEYHKLFSSHSNATLFEAL